MMPRVLAPDAPIDLQMHTTYSDGTWTPDALITYLKNEQFGTAAITDHDRVDQLAAVQTLAARLDFPLLVAVEMTTVWRGEMVDILCFGLDPVENALGDLCASLLHRQQENTCAAYAHLLSRGYTFQDDALQTVLDLPSSRQPDGLSALLHQQGVNAADAGKLLKEAGVDFVMGDPVATVEAAHQSGALCILAHPGRNDWPRPFTEALLDEFRALVPLDGLEAYHALHSPEYVAMYEAYAQKHNLLVSAGSDSHGPDGRLPIKYRADSCRRLLERLGITVA
jgi:3',5'-nucleoside bisphosphate phosphatase